MTTRPTASSEWWRTPRWGCFSGQGWAKRSSPCLRSTSSSISAGRWPRFWWWPPKRWRRPPGARRQLSGTTSGISGCPPFWGAPASASRPSTLRRMSMSSTVKTLSGWWTTTSRPGRLTWWFSMKAPVSKTPRASGLRRPNASAGLSRKWCC